MSNFAKKKIGGVSTKLEFALNFVEYWSFKLNMQCVHINIQCTFTCGMLGNDKHEFVIKTSSTVCWRAVQCTTSKHHQFVDSNEKAIQSCITYF